MEHFSNTLPNRSNEPARAERSPLARAFVAIIAQYQRLTAGRVSACRFYPSCSTYALEAVELHGAWRGSALALRRLLRCRPFGPHGVDLVPPSTPARSTPQ